MDVVQSPEKANAIRYELARFEQARKSSTELQELYANPGIENDAKLKVTTALAKRLGLSDMSTKVLGILIGNRRVNDLESIVEALAEMVRAETDTVAAEVRTATQLNDKEQATLKITWYSVAQDPKNEKQADMSCNGGGFPGTMGSGDRGTMVADAEKKNDERCQIFKKTGKVVKPEEVDAEFKKLGGAAGGAK